MSMGRADPLQNRNFRAQNSTDKRIRTAVTRLEQTGFITLAGKDLEQLASEIGMSYSRFHHLFREQMGLPPRHYIKRARLSEAKRLFDQRFVPVKEVMLTVGFTDASHFSRDFKALTGLSPKRYRNQHWRRNL